MTNKTSNSAELTLDQLFSLSLECKKYDLLISRKIMQQALFKNKNKDGPVKRNLKVIEYELTKFIEEQTRLLNKNNNEIYLFAPHLLPTAISSHKYLYLAWAERVLTLFPDIKLTLFITHEGGHSNPQFSQKFFDESLSVEHNLRFKVIAFPRYLNDQVDFDTILVKNIKCKPRFCLFFETVETYENNFVLNFMRKHSACLSVHCNPKLPINELVDISFVGHEARSKGAVKFLPVIVDENREFDSDFKIQKIDDSRKVVVTAFTNKRIVKNLTGNSELKDALIDFIRHHDIEWHFIGHEEKSDFFDLDDRFIEIQDKFTVYPVTMNLTEYYTQCDVYGYLPGFHGGDSGTRMAVEAGLPCVAMKSSNGGFVKYATNKYVCESLTSYFELIEKIIEDSTFSLDIISHQKNYIEDLKGDDNNELFSKYVFEALESFNSRLP